MSLNKVKLGDIATFINGYPFKPSEWSTEGLEIIRIQNLTKSNSSDSNYFKGSIPEKYKVKYGDILISWSATLDIFEWTGADAWLNQHIFKVKFDKTDVDKRFFKYAIVNIIDSLRSQVHGATMQHITKGKFDATPVYFPGKDEQQRIAAILEKADTLQKNHKQLLQYYDDLAQSLFIDMFGDPEKNSKGWIKKKFGSLVVFPKGLVVPRIEPYSKMLHVGGDNIISHTGELVNYKPAHLLKLISGKYLFDESQLLYNKIRPYLNKVAKPEFKGLCSADMYPIKPKIEYLNRDYLWAIMTSEDFINFSSTVARRANIPKINREELCEYLLPVPPIQLQNQFSKQIQNIEKQKTVAKAQLNESENLFLGLLQQAFNGSLN